MVDPEPGLPGAVEDLVDAGERGQYVPHPWDVRGAGDVDVGRLVVGHGEGA
jgi:hypothetical protein